MSKDKKKGFSISDNDNTTLEDKAFKEEFDRLSQLARIVDGKQNRRQQRERKRKLKQKLRDIKRGRTVKATQTNFTWIEGQNATHPPKKLKVKATQTNTPEKLKVKATQTNTPEKIDHATQTDCWPEVQDPPKKQHRNNPKKKTISHIVLCLKGIVMFAAVVLISSSENISTAKSCDLEKALNSINVNYSVPCNHQTIKDDSPTLLYLGIVLLAVNLIIFLMILIFPSLFQKYEWLLCTFLLFVAFGSTYTIAKYNDILYPETKERDMDYAQLQSAMAIWLKKHYTSDNISSSDEISNSWNKFFIEYNCCAVNQVTGTTNDFDSTPWCTTSGSCQATSSQIPKTCCNGVSEDDYESAPPRCHSSVNPGTYKSNCMFIVKKLSVVNVEECQLSLLQMSLITIGTLEMICAVEMLVFFICFFKRRQGGRFCENNYTL